jgi:hypothetical protein
MGGIGDGVCDGGLWLVMYHSPLVAATPLVSPFVGKTRLGWGKQETKETALQQRVCDQEEGSRIPASTGQEFKSLDTKRPHQKNPNHQPRAKPK